jgi:hypothetical protein
LTTLTTTHALDVPGATLAYDVRRNDESKEPILLLIGSPMGAAGFGGVNSVEQPRPRGVVMVSTPRERDEDGK